MNLRPYQRDAVDATLKAFEQHSTALVTMPTGTGKTICFAHLCKLFGHRGRCMILAHREELITQAANKIETVTGIVPDIEMAGRWAYESGTFRGKAPIVVSSVQTQNSGTNGKRMHRFIPDEFALLIIDEAHHTAAASYRRIVDYYRRNPKLRILGMTATPDRMDRKALGQIFECAPYTYNLEDAIADGWLVPLEQRYVVCRNLDFSCVGSVAGDLNQGELAAVVEEETPMHEMVTPSIEIIGQKRTLFFAVRIQHAKMVSEIFNRHRPNSAACVFGNTDSDERRVTLDKFANGIIQILVNVGVATEGYDNPGIEVVIIGRPTKSRAFYSQMVGRGTRTLPNTVDGLDSVCERRAAIAASAKPGAIIIDFLGNAGRHKLISAADILGGRYCEEDVRAAKHRAAASGKPEDIAELLEQSKRDRLLREALRAQQRAKIKASALYTQTIVDPFRHRQVVPERPSIPKHWWFTPATVKQAALLARRGKYYEGMTMAQASRAIDEIAAKEGWAKRAAT